MTLNTFVCPEHPGENQLPVKLEDGTTRYYCLADNCSWDSDMVKGQSQ